jgi:hypothetical protein
MNRKNLTAAVLAGLAGAAGIAGSAQAVNINPDGLGQVLIYPYYTVNGGNTTLLSVVNTSDDAKAVKVRFLEGQNSREVLDFNLYMSKYDVWTASLKNVGGTPRLKTGDNSCTVPYIYGNGGTQDFLPWALDDGYYNDLDAKGKPSKVYDDISRGAEGHFEMIEMGTLVNSTEANPAWVDDEAYPICDSTKIPGYVQNDPKTHTAAGHPAACLLPRNWTSAELAAKETLVSEGSATAATHKDGVPRDCQQLVDAWTYGASSKTDGYWLKDNFLDIDPPSGGLFGGAAVVNVQNGTMYSYDAKAIDGFWANPQAHDGLGADDWHQEPGTILPSLDSGGNPYASVFWMGDVVDSGHLARGVDAVSFVFMHDQVMNEYTTEAAVGAGTEWVITFPTKQFYVHQDFLDDYEDLRNDGRDLEVPVAPFTSEWFWHTTTYKSTGAVNKAGYQEYPCEVVRLDTIWDREEQTIVDPDTPPGTPVPPIVSPAPPQVPGPDPDGIIPFELCYETSVIMFGPDTEVGTGGPAAITETAILGSENFHNIDNTELGFEYGWARLDMVDATADTDESGAIEADEIMYRDDLGGLYGLPVTGFAVQRFQNAFLGEGADTLANYGGIFQHKYTRTQSSRG